MWGPRLISFDAKISRRKLLTSAPLLIGGVATAGGAFTLPQIFSSFTKKEKQSGAEASQLNLVLHYSPFDFHESWKKSQASGSFSTMARCLSYDTMANFTKNELLFLEAYNGEELVGYVGLRNYRDTNPGELVSSLKLWFGNANPPAGTRGKIDESAPWAKFKGDFAYIARYWVHPEWRGQKLGSRMIKRLQHEASMVWRPEAYLSFVVKKDLANYLVRDKAFQSQHANSFEYTSPYRHLSNTALWRRA